VGWLKTASAWSYDLMVLVFDAFWDICSHEHTAQERFRCIAHVVLSASG